MAEMTRSKLGQVTIFIIIAILIIAGVIIYLLVRGGGSVVEGISPDLRPVYDYYLSCLEDTADQGISLLGEQGGYIETPEFVPGSAYMPFSSQLDFLGQPVPYWMYVSGNNLLKEQVPSKKEMELQLAEYVKERIDDCDFSDYELQGFDVYVDTEKSNVDVKINDLDVDLSVKNLLTIFKGNNSAIIDSHDIYVDSKLGKFYDLSREVYDFEKSNMFLEKYAIDVMRLYAPVDGVEVGCVPKVFIDENIRKDIVDGLAANIQSLKLGGNYYELSSDERKYFVSYLDKIKIDENVNFMYSPNWPTRIEIYGDRVAEPIGMQEGLSAMGFCYVPYHLVYDIDFPVMIQFYDEENLFQFPIAVVISKNQARNALPTTTGVSIESKVCGNPNQDVKVSTYDVDLNPVKAQISFKCLNSVCNIGETTISSENKAVLNAKMPQCVNGFVIARAEGFADAKYQASTNEIDSVNILMNKKYNLDLDLGSEVKQAVVSFSSEDYSTTALYPNSNSVELVEGFYNVSVYVYDNSSLVFPAVKDKKCVTVPESGVAGLFGMETEKCFDIDIPQMVIDYAIVGGGKSQEYILLDDLKDSSELNIRVPLFGPPKNIDELQINYQRVEDERPILEFE